jgi:hypothetical protein
MEVSAQLEEQFQEKRNRSPLRSPRSFVNIDFTPSDRAGINGKRSRTQTTFRNNPVSCDVAIATHRSK